MKTFFTKSNESNLLDKVSQLENVLGIIVEFAYFMASEFGSQDRVDYITETLREYNIDVRVEEY